MSMMQTRRRFFRTAALAGAAAALPLSPAAAEEPGLETTSIKLAKTPAICTMPQMITRQLLEAEGFVDIRYVDVAPVKGTEPLARGDVDLLVHYASNFVIDLAKGETSTVLAGVHVGCFVLFGNERVRRIADLKGKTVGVQGFGISWASVAEPDGRRGRARPQEGHPVARCSGGQAEGSVHRRQDRRLSRLSAGAAGVARPAYRPRHPRYAQSTGHGRNIFAACSAAIGNSCGGIRSRPNARCVRSSRRRISARPIRRWQRRDLVAGGFTDRYDYALQTLKDVSYDQWREYDAEDTIRFYALRMHDAGFDQIEPATRSSPETPTGGF